MPSPEARMLADLLITPASLPEFTTLAQFTAIFPRGHRNSPGIALLYAELQRLRQRDLDAVHRAIATEVSHSHPLRHAYARERRHTEGPAVAGAGAGLDPTALAMEEDALALAAAPASSSSRRPLHTLDTASADIAQACRALEAQLADLQAASAQARADVCERIGALSDLRHGRFAPSVSGQDVGDQVLAALRRLDAGCGTWVAR